jgi:hypothetical protein
MRLCKSCVQIAKILDFKEIVKAKLCWVSYQISFCPDVVRVHLLVRGPTGDVLEYFSKVLHQKLWSDLFLRFLSGVLETAILPARVDLLL